MQLGMCFETNSRVGMAVQHIFERACSQHLHTTLRRLERERPRHAIDGPKSSLRGCVCEASQPPQQGREPRSLGSRFSFVRSFFFQHRGWTVYEKQGLEGYVNPKGRQACKQASSCRDPVTRPETPKVLHAISKAWVE